MDWGIVLGVVGVLGIPLALAILGLTMPATTPGEFRFVRGCFYVAAAISSITIFASLWNYTEGSEAMRVLAAAVAGAAMFAGMAIALDWVNKKQAPTEPAVAVISADPLLKLEASFRDIEVRWPRASLFPRDDVLKSPLVLRLKSIGGLSCTRFC